MNVNISNAAQVATFYADSYDDSGSPIWFQKYNEKFAELIVKDCAEVAHCNFHVDGLTLGGILKDHFGVEE